MAPDRTVIDLDDERPPERRRRWLMLELERLRRLERLRVLDLSDTDQRIVELEHELAGLETSTTGDHP